MKQKKTRPIMAHVSEDVYQKFIKKAEEENRSLSSMLGYLLKKNL